MPDAALPPPPVATRPFVALGAVAGVLIIATLALWSVYGTAVFFEVIAAGLAACF